MEHSFTEYFWMGVWEVINEIKMTAKKSFQQKTELIEQITVVIYTGYFYSSLSYREVPRIITIIHRFKLVLLRRRGSLLRYRTAQRVENATPR
jgi:hypothetical protein